MQVRSVWEEDQACEQEARQEAPLYLAWRTAHRGKALQWFVKRLQQAGALDELLRGDK